MLLVIAAENIEIDDFLNKTKNILIFNTKNSKIYDCHFNNRHFLLAISGVGKAAAALTLTYCISHFHVSNILNIGSAGCLTKTHSITDSFLVSASQYWDVNLTSLEGYKFGQLPSMPQMFYTDKDFNENLKIKLPFLKETAILSGDSFINDSQLDKYKNDDFFELVDMESTALLQTAYTLNKQLSIIKVVSDIVVEKDSEKDYVASAKKCRQKICSILEQIFTSN